MSRAVLLEGLGENPFSCLFQLPEAPWHMAPPPVSSEPAEAGQLFLTSHHSDTGSLTSLCHWPTRWPGRISPLKVSWLELVPYSPLPCYLICSRVAGIWIWIYLGDHYSACTGHHLELAGAFPWCHFSMFLCPLYFLQITVEFRDNWLRVDLFLARPCHTWCCECASFKEWASFIGQATAHTY